MLLFTGTDTESIVGRVGTSEGSIARRERVAWLRADRAGGAALRGHANVR